MRSLTWADVHARRLARSHLFEPAPAGAVVEVARAVGGIHAQVMSAAELALSARVERLAAAGVRDALWVERTLVKTWTLRGTLHLHPADELGLWLSARRALVAARGDAAPEDAGPAVEAIADALDGRCLTRAELAEAIAPRVSAWAREHAASGWGTVLGHAALAGLLVHGPPRGALVTFVRPDQWLGPVAKVEPDTALAEVGRRFLRAYGPASHRELAGWLSVKAGEARRILESIAGELVEVEVDGSAAWLPAGDLDEPAGARGSVRLLAEYDALVMGFRERDRLFPPPSRDRIAAHGKARLEGPGGMSWLLLDGVAGGTWSRKRAGRRIEVRVEPFAPLTIAQRAGVEEEAIRVASTFGLEPSLTVS